MINVTKIFNNKHFNINNDKYFIINLDEKRSAIPDKCPHRGGPLSLGSFCAKDKSIKCPWHDSHIKISALLKREIAGVRINDELFYI